MAILAFNQVTFTDKDHTILKEISFSIEQGGFVTIVGPSGGGKSTLLKLASYLISPSSGTIHFQGKPLDTFNPITLRQEISYCFQTPYLFGKTVEDNLLFPFSLRKKALDKSLVEQWLERFQMDASYINKDITKLSGGEKQRLALIRQLLFEPKVLLLDEVTSALDAQNAALVEEVIRSLNQEGMTIFWVTHNDEQSKRDATKRLTIVEGQLKSLEVLK